MEWIDIFVLILVVFVLLFLCLILYSVVRAASKASRAEELRKWQEEKEQVREDKKA